MMKTSAILFAILLPIVTHAGGSFSVDTELDPILNQVPEIKRILSESLEIQESGWASRIGQAVNPRLGGRRIGPYHVRAKPKGAAGDFTLELIVHTTHVLTDAKGEPSDLPSATLISETFASVEIKPLTKECRSFQQGCSTVSSEGAPSKEP